MNRGFLLLVLVPAFAVGQPRTDDRLDYFETKVRPLLVSQCNNCHSADTNSRGGLRVDDRNGLLIGGNSGPAIVPGHPEKSLLLKAIKHQGKSKMPLGKKLEAEQVAVIEKWIKDGAVWPAHLRDAVLGKNEAKYATLRKEHWAWQPLANPSPPEDRTGWARTPLDRFLAARLASKGLHPMADADRLTLLRRVTFDLAGLPPTLAETEAFLADRSATAFEKVVDRLLAAPTFGERWGRHWLDLARYGESTGSARNLPYPHAWRYRDYVLEAMNNDKPFDRFVQEQVAGDLLPGAGDEQKIATGFLALGVKDVNQRFKVRFVMDNIDEQIDTVTRTLLALTVSCARCHDHKFDPVPTEDYYALAGIFASSDHCAGVRNKMGGGGLDYYDSSMLVQLGAAPPPDPTRPARIEKARKVFQQSQAAFQKIRGTPEGLKKMPNGQPTQRPYRLRMEKAKAELDALLAPRGLMALGVREAKTVGDAAIRIRGEAEKVGPTVPRGFLSVLTFDDAPKVDPKQSGRLQLAQWLTHPGNPLTPRVFVNRAWHHLFGTGLVGSVDNFGVTGEKPSHPELLDYLAGEFRREGWSVKKLVRTLVTSRAYRLGSGTSAKHLEADPANRLVWRHSPRRLSAEEMRDAMLLAAGALDRTRQEGSPGKELPVIEIGNSSPPALRIEEVARSSHRRSVYLPLVRLLTPSVLAAFDPVEQGTATGSRDATTVAPQSLYLLNDPFVGKQASTLAALALAQEGDDRIQVAYRRALSRPATTGEVARVLSYLNEYEAEARRLENPNPKLAAWASFAQALLGSAEFRYVR